MLSQARALGKFRAGSGGTESGSGLPLGAESFRSACLGFCSFFFAVFWRRGGLQRAKKPVGNGRDFMNRSLTVNEARPREDRTGGGPRRSPGGGGGGDRGGYAKRY